MIPCAAAPTVDPARSNLPNLDDHQWRSTDRADGRNRLIRMVLFQGLHNRIHLWVPAKDGGRKGGFRALVVCCHVATFRFSSYPHARVHAACMDWEGRPSSCAAGATWRGLR